MSDDLAFGAGALVSGEMSPSPSAEKKVFGSPVEMSAARASHGGDPNGGSPQAPSLPEPPSAHAEAASAASAVPLEASAASQRPVAEQQHAQEQLGSARSQQQGSRADPGAEHEQRDQAEAPLPALPPEAWASGR